MRQNFLKNLGWPYTYDKPDVQKSGFLHGCVGLNGSSRDGNLAGPVLAWVELGDPVGPPKLVKGFG